MKKIKDPTIPQRDPRAGRRVEELANAREVYKFDYSFQNLPFAETVPPQDQYSARVLAKVVELKAQTGINEALAKARLRLDDDLQHVGAYAIDAYKAVVPGMVQGAIYQIGRKALSPVLKLLGEPVEGAVSAASYGLSNEWPLTVEDYRRMFVSLPKPAAMEHSFDDWFFAYQRVAGTNPVVIERCDLARLDDTFPVTDDFLGRVLRFYQRPSTTLEELANDGRLFITDFKILDEVPTGTWDSGKKRKYLWAPKALFAQLPPSEACPAQLLPIAIQCQQTYDAVDAPLIGPFDGHRWEMAKMVVQVADTHDHGVVRHLGYCHLIMESVTLCLYRHLASNHPLRVLLNPHVEFTLATNEVTEDTTINPGGVTNTFQSVSFYGIYVLLRRAMSQFNWEDESPVRRYERMGVADPKKLPDYAFRDDELLCWEAIHQFVDGYVRLYYKDADDVQGDRELQAFVRELGAHDGGRVNGLPKLEKVSDVVKFIAEIIERATTYHNAINYSVFPYMGFVAGMPLTAVAPGPTAAEATHEDFVRMLPPLHLALGQMADYWTISGLILTRLGEYPKGYFEGEAAQLAEAFKRRLAEIDAEIDQRNETRPFPYTEVKPNKTASSIIV